jgi:acetamidase/formamidase
MDRNSMKRIRRENVIYTFSPKHKPAEVVSPGEHVLFEPRMPSGDR